MSVDPRLCSKDNTKRLLFRNTIEKRNLNQLSDQYERQRQGVENKLENKKKLFISARKATVLERAVEKLAAIEEKKPKDRRSISVFARNPEIIVSFEDLPKASRKISCQTDALSERLRGECVPARLLVRREMWKRRQEKTLKDDLDTQIKAHSAPELHRSKSPTPLKDILPPVTLPPVHVCTRHRRKSAEVKRQQDSQENWENLSDCRYLRLVTKSTSDLRSV